MGVWEESEVLDGGAGEELATPLRLRSTCPTLGSLQYLCPVPREENPLRCLVGVCWAGVQAIQGQGFRDEDDLIPPCPTGNGRDKQVTVVQVCLVLVCDSCLA